MDDYPKPTERPGLGPRHGGPVSLDGMLMVRKGRWTGNPSWKWSRRFCSFRFEAGGSMSVYKNHPEMETSVVKTVYSRLQRNLSMRDFRITDASASHSATSRGESTLDFEITGDLPWIIKDIVADPATFVLEIDPGNDDNYSLGLGGLELEGMSLATRERLFSEQDVFSDDGEPDDYTVGGMGSSLGGEDIFNTSDHIMHELENARRHGKPLRIYFKCNSHTNEKGLWLKAFSSFGRLSRDTRSKKSVFRVLFTGMHLGTSRIRNRTNEMLARDTRHLDMTPAIDQQDVTEAGDETNDVSLLVQGVRKTSSEKEFRVLPSYAYPHRWMTKSEMIEEMILPSDWFHDLRVPSCKDKEIGSLQVEVLQCIGLPRLDRGSDSDAVVYLVCGSYAFSTDIIYSRTNPMWLRKSRRACIFPLFHGYARLYVGVFDDEPRRVKDDFAGRVVLDLARLRPNSTYDVTLPLRLSTHVYTRRRRGAIRLRLTLNWKSERDALLTYVPKTLRIPLPQHSKPNFDTTVMCNDQKAFRNIAITVHGAHLPGRFTFNQLRAVIREINFTRKYVFSTLLRNIKEVRQWKNPAMSAFVFFSWMHCIYANSFSLVPAYTMLFLLLNLMQSYARYGLDGPAQRGFVPPSWEEMFMALLRGGDRKYRPITPLDYRPDRRQANYSTEANVDSCRRRTYEPKGKKLLGALGFVSAQDDPNADHIEFPFADGNLYPKLTVRECLANPGMANDDKVNSTNGQLSTNGNESLGESGLTPSRASSTSRFNLDVDWMRKDSSGTKDYDAEESKFGAGRVVIRQGRRAASKISEKTGIDYVVRTTQSGISSGVGHVSSGVKSGVKSIRQSARRNSMSSVRSFDNRSGTDSSAQMREAAPDRQNIDRALLRDDGILEGSQEDEDENSYHANQMNNGIDRNEDSFERDPEPLAIGNEELTISQDMETSQNAASQSKEYPDQDIDVTGPSTGKKITDDLAEVRDKMHELTWHLFDDHTYVIKNPSAVFFNELKKGKSKSSNPKKEMDKYLHMGKYSHSNPFVARVGTYVEPIISSIYSILCLFRAGFNLFTWRDPFLTFLLSFFCGLASIVLFFFPWRLFLFAVGLFVVGPQNWALRVLREQGHLPEKKKEIDNQVMISDKIPPEKPLFTAESRKTGNEPRKPTDLNADPREVHHVVVPYGPLFYQRCNDWPPEPQYSKVVPYVGATNESFGRFGNTASDARSVMSFESRGVMKFRRKLLRKRANTASSTQSNGRKVHDSRFVRSRSNSGESFKTK